jgi:DNA-binding GntR family transcriptional regulator
VDEYFKNYYLDQEFHQLFVKCSENKRIIQIYSNLGTHAYAYYVYGKQDRAGMIKGVNEHEAVYQALLRQDDKALLRSMEIHIINAKNNIYQMLQKGEPKAKENCS